MIAMSVLACWPPQAGPLLLVPLSGAADGQLVTIAVRAGAALLARGPVHGSIVVKGDLARLRAGIAGTDIVILAAPPAGCGQRDDA